MIFFGSGILAQFYAIFSDKAMEEVSMNAPQYSHINPNTYPQITRPLSVSQVPGFHGEEIFLIDPADTNSWLGPLGLYDGGELCMFRLIEVIPERNARYDEIEDQLYVMARNRLEEQTTVDVMRELEEKYGLIINEDILEKLPEDLSSWAEL